MKVIPVIMSGGSGTRLWPLSTAERPKQFHALLSDDVMIVETAKRFVAGGNGVEFLPPIVIAGAAHGALVTEQLGAAGITPSAIVLEPMGRNTAAAAAVAALAAQQTDPEAMVLLCPADHIVGDPAAFHAAIAQTGSVVSERIVTFGMTPTAPETGFGYIKQGPELTGGVYAIEAFKEKPVREVAERYIAEGGYSWNSGVFFYSPGVMLEEFEALQPGVLAGSRAAMEKGVSDGSLLYLDEPAFAALESLPVDIAIMERTSRGAVAPCSVGWADVGSWSEYWRLSEKDAGENALEGSVIAQEVGRSLVRAEPGVHVSVRGLKDIIVVATGDSVMVMPMSEAQNVKGLIPKS